MKLRTLKHFLVAGGVSLLALSSPAYATLKEALEALEERDYPFALEELNRLINQEKNAEACYHLGRMYYDGLGLEQNEETAMKYFFQAAQQGNEKAALKVGNAYYLGEGVEKSAQEAFKWYKVAAEQGNYLALYNIGLMYEEGTDVKKSLTDAFRAYRGSAEQGYAPAQIALGHMFFNGIGTPQDYNQAVFWYKLAADQGDLDAQMKLAKLYANTSVRGLAFNIVGAHIYFNLIAAYGKSPLKEEAAELRDKLAETMRHDDVISAQEQANKWKKKTREESLPSLAEQDFMGQYVDVQANIKKDKPEEGEAEIKITVQTELKSLLLAAGISRRDLNKAVRADDFSEIEGILKQKAEKGDATAHLALADLYVLGQGLKENPKEAVEIYQKLAAKANPIAFFRLAPMYCEGKGVAPDLVECYKLMLLAKKYADEASQPFVSEALQMLDENLDQEIRDSGKKQADEWKPEPEKVKKKKFSFFSKSDDDDDENESAIKRSEKKEEEKKKEELKKKEEEEKKKTETKEKKKASGDEDDDDLFSGL
ncbi:MAG: sel1 repeat family protein [Alphaproteobacteria bacterium]|nr:sel1 repeat family protein [Alphaproteobacteria bacterium]